MRRFVAADILDMAGWYAARGLPCPRSSSLPEIGFIEPHVACGFLYRTDSDVGMMEGMITNPCASLSARVRAMDEIMDSLIEAAQLLGVRHVVATCKRKSMEQRAQRHGLKFLGSYRMVTRELA